ncbi:hypothetical protein NUW54_g5560 [Trametes sanguinea]|uniref:Uncharacterized protein n=1 Tax=Trametes sanguinea TaxID=158606 RepID=A0ACC1PWL9_9APHY|nr:hypothetical protein NUW54_g5560 [Trametes sanguinea]
MRTASDFDRPFPGENAATNLFLASPGFDISLQNIPAAGVPIVMGIVSQWTKRFEGGIKPSNYIGDIFGTLGGMPDFGPGSIFGGKPAVAEKRALRRPYGSTDRAQSRRRTGAVGFVMVLDRPCKILTGTAGIIIVRMDPQTPKIGSPQSFSASPPEQYRCIRRARMHGTTTQFVAALTAPTAESVCPRIWFGSADNLRHGRILRQHGSILDATIRTVPSDDMSASL